MKAKLACHAARLNMRRVCTGATLRRHSPKDAMLNFLFRRLTETKPAGEPLFAAVTAEARQPHWYVEGGIPDSIDGRFAVLATLTALVLVRFEALGEAGNRESVALTERFITVMESEHRELGLGDPTLGKKVRKLVGSLAKRVELWRGATTGGVWLEATRQSLYKGEAEADALRHSVRALERFRQRLEQASLETIAEGRFDD